MKRNTFGFILLLIFSSLASHKVLGQVAGMQSLSPSMLSQVGSMSDRARNDLAAQYGINLDDLGMGSNLSMGQDVGNPIEISSQANEILYERIINAEENTKKADKYRKKNIPIFERDNSTITDLPIYGQFLFDGNYSTFAPVNNVPVPSTYVLGPGDSLRILMYGMDDSEMNLVVNRDGSIDFPELGNISIAGMTFSEARSYIKNRVSKQMIGIEISISIGRLRSIDVFMAGEARVPGAYTVSGLSTVSQLLFVAGGITDIGSLRNIQVKRSSNLVASFDLYDLLTKGNVGGDIRLESGDVILIPPAKKSIFIDGAVRRPGRYELKEDETIADLIELIGGFENRAYVKQIHIERYDRNTDIPSIINLDLTNKLNLDFKVTDGDIIRVAEVSDRLSNSITLKGAVKRPGKYGWYEGMRFSDILSSINIDFSSNFDMSKGLIIRRNNINNYDIETIDLNIKDALLSPKSDTDPTLELYDEILIFSLGFNEDELNNIELYDPDDDITHPLYGQEEGERTSEESEIMESMMIDPNKQLVKNPYMISEAQKRDLMTDKELLVVIHESKKREEYNLLNKGKRRVLLKSVIDKLSQQATSLNSPRVISISGAVKIPGNYPLSKNTSYMDLIQLAGGYKDDAYIESAEIRKTIVDNLGSMVVVTSNIDLTELSDTKLESRDHIHIRTIKDWDATDTVFLGGEVFYPGSYFISPNETLSSVIKRAGGFTSESFIGGAVFTRESIKLKEREQLQILGDTIRRDQAARSMTKESEDFSVGSSEIEASIEALLSSAVYGRLIIDVSLIIDGDYSADIVLQDGDSLIIPKSTNAVTVVGEVRRSGSFVLQDFYDVDDYLQLAAGLTSRADKKEIYIIKANGSVKKSKNKRSFLKFSGQNNSIQAGDTLVVPIKSSYQTPLNLYSTVSQVVFQSIASIAAFTTVLR